MRKYSNNIGMTLVYRIVCMDISSLLGKIQKSHWITNLEKGH